jgi:hypothetical protein
VSDVTAEHHPIKGRNEDNVTLHSDATEGKNGRQRLLILLNERNAIHSTILLICHYGKREMNFRKASFHQK